MIKLRQNVIAMNDLSNNIDNQLKCGLKTKSEELTKWQAMKDNK